MKRQRHKSNQAIICDQFDSWEEVEGVLPTHNLRLSSECFMEVPLVLTDSSYMIDEDAADWVHKEDVPAFRRACTRISLMSPRRGGPRATATSLWNARNDKYAMWAILLCAYDHDAERHSFLHGAGYFVLQSAVTHASAYLRTKNIEYGWHHRMTGALPGALFPNDLLEHTDLSYGSVVMTLFAMEVAATLAAWQLVKIVKPGLRGVS